MAEKNGKRTRKSNGEGSVWFNEQRGVWMAEVTWTDKTKQRHSKRFSDKYQTGVKAKLKDFKKQLLLNQGNAKEASVTFKEYAMYWMESAQKNKLKPTSYARKMVTLRQQVFPYIGLVPIETLTIDDVQGLVNKLDKEGLSYSTVKKAYEAVNGCMKRYVLSNRYHYNPCIGVELPIQKRKDVSKIKYFVGDEILKIQQGATRTYKNGKPVFRYGYLIVAFMYTGLRLGEMLALTWDDVDFENRTVTVNKSVVRAGEGYEEDDIKYKFIEQDSTKTSSGTRVVPLCDIALDAFRHLKEMEGNSPYVASTASGNHPNYHTIDHTLRAVLLSEGIRDEENLCGVHALRHTFASMLFANGCSVKVVSELLGHSNTKITEDIYIHLIQRQKVAAVEELNKYSIPTVA